MHNLWEREWRREATGAGNRGEEEYGGDSGATSTEETAEPRVRRRQRSHGYGGDSGATGREATAVSAYIYIYIYADTADGSR